MKSRELKKALYQALKIETKKRKFKLSAEHDIYKKEGEYFFCAWYFDHEYEDGIYPIEFRFQLKYHRFDELQAKILFPELDIRFTDKYRANSGYMCYSLICDFHEIEFSFDGTEESLPDLAIRILDYIEGYYRDFIEKVNSEYGGLDGWYIANKEINPLLAGLVYLDKGDMNNVLECLSHPNIGGDRSFWSSVPNTEEQLKRALANGYNAKFKYFDRSTKQRFEDYVTTMRKGLEWTSDKAKFGLLPEER